MHPYIPHLLEDIAAAHRTEIPEEDTVQTLEEEFEELEKWVSRENQLKTFGYYCGLESKNFPPPEQLNDKDMRLVFRAFKKMMLTWNHTIDLPKKLPPAFAYQLMVGVLNKETMVMNTGFSSFDFCTGYAPECELKEYCPCLKDWDMVANRHLRFTQEIKIEKLGDDELPF